MLSVYTIQQASNDHAESQYLGLQVGALSGGLAGALWSPDGNLLCLVSLQGQLLLMNKVSAPHASVLLACTLLLGQHQQVQKQNGRVQGAMKSHAVALRSCKSMHPSSGLLLPKRAERRFPPCRAVTMKKKCFI